MTSANSLSSWAFDDLTKRTAAIKQALDRIEVEARRREAVEREQNALTAMQHANDERFAKTITRKLVPDEREAPPEVRQRRVNGRIVIQRRGTT